MKITAQQYAQALFELTENKNKAETEIIISKFIQRLKKNSGLKMKDDIIKKFIIIHNKANNIIEANITSKQQLDTKQLDLIIDFLKKKYTAQEVVINNRLDEQVLGGIIIKVDDEVIDGSIKRQVEEMKRVLSQ